MKRLKLFFACLLMAVLSIGQVWATTYKLTQVTSVSAGNKYVFVQDNHAMNNTTSSSALQTTTSYSTTGLNGNETYVWTLETATGGFYMKNVSLASNQYLNNASSTSVSFGNKSSIWTFTFDESKNVLIQNKSNSNRYLGFTNATSYAYKAYATSSMTYAHAVKAYVLEAETSTYTITAVSNNESWGTVSGTTNITASPEPGYRVKAGDEGYTVTSGTADVTNNGDNTFTVSASSNCTVQINFEAIPTHRIIFNNGDVKSIADAIVAEGETYNITETIEAALIASCTYKKFEGWTLASSIADASVKPVLVTSIDMEGADVNLYAVYSATSAGGSSTNEEIASIDIVAYATANSWAGSGSPQVGEIPLNADIVASTNTDGNNGKYYTDWRLYHTDNGVLTITAAEGCTLKSATITFTIAKGGTLIGAEEAEVTSGTPFAISGSSYNFTVEGGETGKTNGQVKVTAISVTYDKTTSGTTTFSLDAVCAAAGQCVAPVFTPGAGTYDAAQSVSLSTTTDGADIYYTSDGTTPTSGSTKYTTAIPVAQNTTIKAIAVKDTWTDSEIAEGEFKIRYTQPTLTPSAAPVDGKYTSAITVAIAAEGADAIYYTLDGTTPTNASTLYTAPVELSTAGTKTIKAIAVKANYESSNVATGTYVMDLPYGSIAEFIASGTSSDVKRLQLTNAYILGVNGYSIYVQDASAKGIILYNKDGYGSDAWVADLVAGKQITGIVSGTNTTFNGQPELGSAVFVTPTITAGTRPTPADITAINEAAFTANTMKLVKVSGVYYQESPSNKNYTFTADEDGLEADQKVYDQFGMIAAHTMVEVGDQCDLIGIMARYNANYQLLPVLVTDIVADADAATPVFTPDGGVDEDNAAQVDINSYVSISVAAKNTVTPSSVQITSEDPVSVTAISSRDFYRNTSVTKWYYGNAASASYDITIQGVTTQGTVVAQVGGSDVVSAAAGDEVHILIDPNAHFELATIKVNGNDPTQVTAKTEYKFDMPAEAVTIAVTWNEDAKYALTFTAGDGSGDAPAMSGTSYYAGTEVTLPANTFTYDATHKFTAWRINGVDYAAGAEFTMPAAATEAVAQWKELPDFASGDWILVEDEAELTAGSYVIIAAKSYDYAMMSYASGNNCGEESAVKSSNLLTYKSQFAIFEIKNFVQEEVVTGKSFYDVDNENYLYSPSANNYLKAKTQQDKYAAWDIEISEGTLTAFNKGNTAYEIQYNTSGMFSCYKSTQKAIALYKYYEPSLKLSYDKNTTDEVTNLPGMQVADNDGKVTVSSEVPLRENYIFNGWKDGESVDHAAGDVITLTANMTLYAQWRAPQNYTVTYDANGGTPADAIADAVVLEGTAYAIEDNAYKREGYSFVGWKAYDALHNELTITSGQFVMPASNVTVVAQWNENVLTDFLLVTDLAQLQNGDKVYIVAKESAKAMSTQNGTTYREEVNVVKVDNNIYTAGVAPVEFTLGKDESTYTFSDATGYLYAAGTANTGKNYLDTKEGYDETCDWNITIDENGTVISSVSNAYTPYMQYNNSSHRFACYHGATQEAIVLYKKATPCANPTFTPAAGTYTSAQNVTIACATDGATIYYTIDGTDPTLGGTEYAGAIAVDADMTIRAVATKAGMLNSAVVEAVYTINITPEPPVVVWEELREGATSGKYYTVCLSKKVVDFRGGIFWNMSKRGTDLAYLVEATVDELEKGKPFIFEVTGANLEVVYEGDATNVAGINGALYGTFEAMNQAALEAKADELNSDIYLLSNNQLWNVTISGASSNSLAAGRAYIVYNELDEVSEAPHAPGRRVRAVPMGQNTVTGIDELNASETPVKMIINGQLYILRGEKMYNANGQIVK